MSLSDPRLSGYDGNYYATTLSAAERDLHWPALSGTVEAEVCVVGGGLAGMNTLLGLLERGVSAVLLEARRIGWGASGRNAGFVAKGYSAGEAVLAGKVGLEKAQALVTLTKDARKIIRRRIEQYGIDCAPVADGVLTVSWRDNPEKLQETIRRANHDFGLGFEFWPREKVRAHCKTEKYFDGIYSPHDFQMNPLKYLRGLARAAQERGGAIFEDSAVTTLAREGSGAWRIETAGGTVRAKNVVLCTSVYGQALDRRLAFSAIPVQTYIMVTAPMGEDVYAGSLNSPHAIYDTRFCSDYYRRLPEGRLLWGGRVGLFSHPDDIARALTEDILKVYPQLDGQVKPDFAWSGLLSYATHKMPLIGRLENGLWYNTGFGGHGLCPTTAGGELIAAALASNDPGWRHFDAFPRGFAGGPLGRYGALLVYLWWRLRDQMGV
jgi:gamma-glutamylputrescine oxidase